MTQMIQETWPTWLATRAEEFASLDNDGLIAAIRDRFNAAVENLAQLAVLVRMAEERGMDLSTLPAQTLVTVLRRIAHGQTLPEVAQKYLGNASLLHRLSTLPLPDQRRVASDTPLAVVHRTPDGVDVRMVPPSRMTKQEQQQVFAFDHVRDETEQRGWLEAKRPQIQKSGANYVLDKKHGLVRVLKSPLELTKKELADILTAL